MSQLDWISPVDRARLGNTNDVMTRLDSLETSTDRHDALNVAASDLQDLSDDLGMVRSGTLYFGSGDPYTLSTGPVGVLIEALGIHIFNNTEVGRFGDLNGFLGYAIDVDGIAIGDPTAYLTYDQTNGLRIKGTIAVLGNVPYTFDVWDEHVPGVDGTSLIYNSAQIIQNNLSLHVILNGVWLANGGHAYSDFDTSPQNRITFSTAPAGTDVIRGSYAKLSDRSIVYNETPVNHVNAFIYDFANNLFTNSLVLTVNGLEQDNINDWHGGPNGFGFTAQTMPRLGDELTIGYNVTPNAKFIGQEQPTGLVNGVNAVFTLANNYVSGTLIVAINGIRMVVTTDYTESAVNQITFVAGQIPQTGDLLWITYISQ